MRQFLTPDRPYHEKTPYSPVSIPMDQLEVFVVVLRIWATREERAWLEAEARVMYAK